MKLHRLAAGAAIGLGALLPATAAAIPIRDFTALCADGDICAEVDVSFTVYSPPGADSCAALYGIRVRQVGTDWVTDTKRGRLNVCRDGNEGWTRGAVTRRLSFAGKPRARYEFLVAAAQDVNGHESLHGIRRVRFI